MIKALKIIKNDGGVMLKKFKHHFHDDYFPPFMDLFYNNSNDTCYVSYLCNSTMEYLRINNGQFVVLDTDTRKFEIMEPVEFLKLYKKDGSDDFSYVALGNDVPYGWVEVDGIDDDEKYLIKLDYIMHMRVVGKKEDNFYKKEHTEIVTGDSRFVGNYIVASKEAYDKIKKELMNR